MTTPASPAKVDHQGIYEKWMSECKINGLTFEVMSDICNDYLNKHPEECLQAMDCSMRDWDF